MNYSGLKRASRQSLLDSGVSPRKLTLLFLLCFYALSVSCDVVTYLLDQRLSRVSGLEAAAVRGRYDLWSYVLLVAVNLVWMLWTAGYASFALHVSRGRPTGFGDFLTGFRLFGKVLALYLLQMLYIWLWSMLFLIPGLVAAYRYRMAVYVLLDDPSLSATEAINASKRLTYGHKLELLTLDLSFLWYYLPGIAVTALVYAYNYDLLPALAGRFGLLFVYLVNLLVPFAVDVLAKAYVQTTTAHAYNWLVSLDRARREALHNAYRPQGGPNL